MLSHSQMKAVHALNRDRTSFFSQLPRDVVGLIGLCYDPNPKSEIAIALGLAADARKEPVTTLLAMLAKNPQLLLQAGDVITPGGHKVERITIYEYCLGAGDPELAKEVQARFDRIPHGEDERIRQYEPYRPYIDGIMTQEPYDLTPLLDMIKHASAPDVTALLNKDMTHKSALRDAMAQFRQAHAPKVLTGPCMHYNYRSLQHAFELLDREWDNLYRASGNNYDMIRLVWRQLIGFEMRRLPGVDRCRVAQGLGYDNWERTYKYKNDAGEMPVTVSDDSVDGLGGDFAVDVVGGRGRARGGVPTGCRRAPLENLCRAKASNLQNLCPGQSRRPGV